MTRNEIFHKLNKKLNSKRMEHSIGVEYTAASLAFVYGVDIEKARLAGLLHDCAKYGMPEKKLKKATEYNIHINKWEKSNPDLLHAKLGAVYALEKYEIVDEEIIEAIKWHTTGRPNMTMLDKIIYVADYIEPNRRYIKDLDIVRKEAFQDINKAIVIILENTINYINDRDNIDPLTIETLEYYK